jgi:hypothetical protein
MGGKVRPADFSGNLVNLAFLIILGNLLSGDSPVWKVQIPDIRNE